VYILANHKTGTLYIGVTSDIVRRLQEHKDSAVESFSKKYATHRLVYIEQTDDIQVALNREKRLKKWKRQWKIELIEQDNPDWKDLSADF